MTTKRKPLTLVCLGPVSKLEWFVQTPDRTAQHGSEFPGEGRAEPVPAPPTPL